jgi:trehalose 6-phosphate synthase/phosphatase
MRLIIVSNRLPLTFQSPFNKTDPCKRSIGGLVTGIESYLKSAGHTASDFESHLWVGWTGTFASTESEELEINSVCHSMGYMPVFFDKTVVERYYHGFCNRTVWPLFHHFPHLVEFDENDWIAYQQANEAFCRSLKKIIRDDDVVWIHDYHLMLLPQLLRQEYPHLAINFFLHIPFPTIDLFRHLPKEIQSSILGGIMGADVVGFHTYQYAKDFLDAGFKTLGVAHRENSCHFNDRNVSVDVFPMGIDYGGICELAKSTACETIRDAIKRDFRRFKLMLSIDRLDYTKGILNRLIAFDALLKDFPQWREKVVLMLIVAPSRREINSYQQMKRAIDEWVGNINGEHSTNTWTPIIYQYRQYDLMNLCALYGASDIGLVTPLRDGMNLIAKEFVASHHEKDGVLILSEMAGAITELTDAISVNPFNPSEITNAMNRALEMSATEMVDRNTRMHRRLEQYDVVHWADDLMQKTLSVKKMQSGVGSKLLNDDTQQMLVSDFKRAKSRLLLFDYDGTLAPFAENREAIPSQQLLSTLRQISGNAGNKVVIISGRDRKTLSAWFQDVNVSFGADLGAWVNDNGNWILLSGFDTAWKTEFERLLKRYATKLPGSSIEEKECALVWDYRNTDPGLRLLRVGQLEYELQQILPGYTQLDCLKGNNSFIIRNIGSNKGDAAAYWLSENNYDFILAIGDDDADEELFNALPAGAHSLRVGHGATTAKYYIPRQELVSKLLDQLN